MYLNDVATKGPPQALLFRIVELIIGEVPGILHFRLWHVLSWEKPYFSLKITTFKPLLCLNWFVRIPKFHDSHMISFCGLRRTYSVNFISSYSSPSLCSPSSSLSETYFTIFCFKWPTSSLIKRCALACPEEAAYLLWLIFYHSSLPQQDAALFDCRFLLILLRWGVWSHLLLFIGNFYNRQQNK